MKADPLLPLYREQYGARAGRDRLELLTALIEARRSTRCSAAR